MEDLTLCQICFDSYNLSERVPLRLACQHVFCRQCLQSMHHSLKLTYSTFLACPLCRKVTDLGPGVKALPQSEVTIKLLCHLCALCLSTPGTRACGHCQRRYCDCCSIKHLLEWRDQLTVLNTRFDQSDAKSRRYNKIEEFKALSDYLEQKLKKSYATLARLWLQQIETTQLIMTIKFHGAIDDCIKTIEQNIKTSDEWRQGLQQEFAALSTLAVPLINKSKGSTSNITLEELKNFSQAQNFMKSFENVPPVRQHNDHMFDSFSSKSLFLDCMKMNKDIENLCVDTIPVNANLQEPWELQDCTIIYNGNLALVCIDKAAYVGSAKKILVLSVSFYQIRGSSITLLGNSPVKIKTSLKQLQLDPSEDFVLSLHAVRERTNGVILAITASGWIQADHGEVWFVEGPLSNGCHDLNKPVLARKVHLDPYLQNFGLLLQDNVEAQILAASNDQVLSACFCDCEGCYLVLTRKQLKLLSPGGSTRLVKDHRIRRPSCATVDSKEGRIFICTVSGKLHVVSTKDFSPLFQVRLQPSIVSPRSCRFNQDTFRLTVLHQDPKRHGQLAITYF